MKKTAIFDIDGTIFRSSLLIELVEGLVKHSVFPEEARSAYATEHEAWLDRRGTYEAYIEAVIASFMKHIKGVPYASFIEVSKEVVHEQQWYTYRYTRDLVTRLKEDGYFLLAISQSPKGTLDAFCSSLGFDKVYGRVYEIGPEDRFTGDVSDLHLIANKANIVHRAVERENLTLTGSIGVGDTEGDIPVLELVDHAICFNPNKVLYRHALLNSWRTVVERKDVIYHLNTNANDPAIIETQ